MAQSDKSLLAELDIALANFGWALNEGLYFNNHEAHRHLQTGITIARNTKEALEARLLTKKES